MFKNIGKKLKVVGKVWFWVGVVIAAIFLLFALVAGVATKGVGFLPMLFLGALYMLIFLVAAWNYYGIGAAVDNTEENKALLEQNQELLRQNNELLNKLCKLEEENNNSSEE